MSKRARLIAAALAVALGGIVVATAAFAWHQGYRAYVVRTGSMMPTYHAGDAVIDRPAASGYQVGDPITFEVAPGSLVTHRLSAVDVQGKLLTKGDRNKRPDAWRLSPEQVRGVVAQGLPKMGYVLVFLRQKTGIAGVMTSALSVVLLWGLCFPGSTSTPNRPAPPRIPRQRRGPLVRIPRQRVAGSTAGQPAPTSSNVVLRMPPTPPPVRRLPPTSPPRRPLVTMRIPLPRTA